MALPVTKMGSCTLQKSKGSTSGLILARKSLEIEVNDSCPITSGLPSSSGPFLYRMENKTAYKSKDRGTSSAHRATQVRLRFSHQLSVSKLKNFREPAEHFCKGAKEEKLQIPFSQELKVEPLKPQTLEAEFNNCTRKSLVSISSLFFNAPGN